MKPLSRDPIKTAARRSTAQRRVGVGAICTTCGESRPEALIPRSRPRRCIECDRRKNGKKTTDAHHIAGRNNSPITLVVRANDHRAALSTAQHEWPITTLQNKDESPLLRAAAALRGVADLISELVVGFIRSCASLLESLHMEVSERLGPTWWVDTSVAGWRP